jgi:SAM-dependent methyltransferase
MADLAFHEAQRRAFEQPDEPHFEWQVGNPVFARTEQRLLESVSATPVERFLEVGSGEGANLVNLRTARGGLPRLTVGLDLFVEMVWFGQRRAAPARFVCGDALRLPFAAGSFDLVLCRDLLHHLEDRAAALRELRRVCRAGGEVCVIEPNGRNPLIALFAMSRRHERGQLETTPRRLQRQAAGVFGHAEVEMRQPMPVARAILHYSWGSPALAGRGWAVRLIGAWDALCARIVPRRFWAYIVLRVINGS